MYIHMYICAYNNNLHEQNLKNSNYSRMLKKIALMIIKETLQGMMSSLNPQLTQILQIYVQNQL